MILFAYVEIPVITILYIVYQNCNIVVLYISDYFAFIFLTLKDSMLLIVKLYKHL